MEKDTYEHFSQTAREASRFLSASCAIKQADRLLYSIQAHNGDGDPYWLSDSGAFFAVSPGCIQKQKYGEFGFNPEFSSAQISWRVYARNRTARDELGYQHTLRDMHYDIRCRRDGISVYHVNFVEKDARERHLSDLTLNDGKIEGWAPEKCIFDDTAITGSIGLFLLENAPDGVADLATISNGLREFRSVALKRDPLEITPDEFLKTLMDEVCQRLNPQYADMVSFRTDGSAVYLQMPGQKDVNILESDYNLLPQLPKLYQDFRCGNRSLGEIRSMILKAVDGEVAEWTGFAHIYDWQNVRDRIKPVRVDQSVVNQYSIDALHHSIDSVVLSKQRGDGTYVFRIYPFQDNPEYRDRSFLVTNDIAECWDMPAEKVLDQVMDEAMRKPPEGEPPTPEQTEQKKIL